MASQFCNSFYDDAHPSSRYLQTFSGKLCNTIVQNELNCFVFSFSTSHPLSIYLMLTSSFYSGVFYSLMTSVLAHSSLPSVPILRSSLSILVEVSWMPLVVTMPYQEIVQQKFSTRSKWHSYMYTYIGVYKTRGTVSFVKQASSKWHSARCPLTDFCFRYPSIAK